VSGRAPAPKESVVNAARRNAAPRLSFVVAPTESRMFHGSSKAPLVFVLVASFAAPAAAQGCFAPPAAAPTPGSDPAPPGNPYHFGMLEPGSTSLGTTLGGAHLVRMYGGDEPVVMTDPLDLGIPASIASEAKILSIAYANDEFGVWDIAEAAVGGRHLRIAYAVKPATAASPFEGKRLYGVETTQLSSSSCASNFSSVGPFPISGAEGVAGDQITAVAFEQTPMLPIYFTVSKETAAMMRSADPLNYGNVDSCDVLISPFGSMTHAAVVWEGHLNGLGLDPEDEITSLAINSMGCAVFSLSHRSPSIVLQRPLFIAGPLGSSDTAPKKNMLIGFVPSGSSAGPSPYMDRLPGYPFPWALAKQLGFYEDIYYYGAHDELMDMWIGDPFETTVAGVLPTLPLRSDVGNQYVSRRSLFVDDRDGEATGRVFVRVNDVVQLAVNVLPNANYAPSDWVLFAAPHSRNGAPWFVPFPGIPQPFAIPLDIFSALPASFGSVALVGNMAPPPPHANYVFPQVPSNGFKWSGSVAMPPVVADFQLSLIVGATVNGVFSAYNNVTLWVTALPALSPTL
jgi:hypothetical protein